MVYFAVGHLGVGRELPQPIIIVIVPARRRELAPRSVIIAKESPAGIMDVRYAAVGITIVVRLCPPAASRDLVAFPDHLSGVVVGEVDRGPDIGDAGQTIRVVPTARDRWSPVAPAVRLL